MERRKPFKRIDRRTGKPIERKYDSKDPQGRRSFHRPGRQRQPIPKGTKIDYKNLALLQKYLTERGKVLTRRFSNVTAGEQRQLVESIKRARFLGLLPVGSAKRK